MALFVLGSILLIEGAILVPSYRNYERDLLLRLEQVGGAIVGASLRGKGHQSARNILLAARLMLVAPEIAGGIIQAPDGRIIGTFGEVPVMVGIGQPTFQTTFQRSRDGAKYVVVYDMKDFNLS